MTDPLYVRVGWVGWYHIWHCFQWIWKTDERCLFEQRSTWENFLFCGATHSKALKQQICMLFEWMAWNTNLVVSYCKWRRNVEQVTILWGGPGVQQSSACVSRCICLFLSMFGEPYPLAWYPHILLYDFPGNYLSHPRQKETSKHCCLSPPHVIINQSELKAMPTAMIYEYITGLIEIL